MGPEFREKNLVQWEETLKKIFPEGIPSKTEWTNLESMIGVLNRLGSIPSLNHTFTPGGGGLDLTGASTSVEQGCIELNLDGIIYIIKPKFLKFYSFPGKDLEWAYFRLETGGLQPSGIYEKLNSEYEELTELRPGKYIDRSYADYGYYGADENGNEKPLPDESRVVSRLLDGAFVTFAKGSIYNAVNETYDGRHNKMADEVFYEYIKRSAEKA